MNKIKIWLIETFSKKSFRQIDLGEGNRAEFEEFEINKFAFKWFLKYILKYRYYIGDVYNDENYEKRHIKDSIYYKEKQ